MQHNTIYKNWVPQWLILPLLILAMFPHVMLLSLFSSNSAFMASFLDIDSDDIQYLLILMYGTIVVTLLVYPRFMAYFSTKYYILLMSSMSIIVLYLLSVVSDYRIVIFLRILEGIFGNMEGIVFLPLIIGELKTKHSKVIGYCFLYCFMLIGGNITTSLLKNIIQNYDFHQIMLMIVYVHLIILIIALSIFNSNRYFEKKPLYQLDLSGWFLLWSCLQSGAYGFIYGKRLLWFESNTIIFCFLYSITAGGLFILKQWNARRPIFNFEIFSYRNCVNGAFLFFIFYFIRSALNNVYNIMAVVWDWPWDYIANVQYFNVAGTVIGFITSAIFLMRSFTSRTIFTIGFMLLAIDCAWFTYTFYPDTTLQTIAPPLFIEGVAQGILFTPLVMYLTTGIPNYLVSNGVVIGTSTRFWSTTIGYSFMQNALLYLTTEHANKLSFNFVDTNPVFNMQWNQTLSNNFSKLTNNDAVNSTAIAYKAKINAQALLLSNMEIYTWLFWLAFATTIILLLYKPIKITIRNII